MKKVFNLMLWLVIAVVLGLLLLAYLLYAKVLASPKMESQSCISTETEQCPTEDFLRGYNHWVGLKYKLALSTGRESVVDHDRNLDEFNGLTGRLRSMVSQGYRFDEVKRRIVREIPTVVPPVPVPPVPVKK